MTAHEPQSTPNPEALEQLCRQHRGQRDPDITAQHRVDWTGHWEGHTGAVFGPHTTTELAALVAGAHHHRVPLCVQGGNTSLTGGATPYGEAVVHTRHLNHLDFDTSSGRVTAGAGVTAGQIAAAVAGSGWELGVDLASRDSATIGGMISTNAGGLKALRWGQMGRHILGADIVLGDGTRLTHLDPPERDNTGPRWHQLLAGAEGTLGVICAATIQLVPHEPTRTALLAFDTIDEALDVAQRARARLTNLRTVELMLAEGIELVAAQLDTPPPLDGKLHTAYLLIDTGGTDDNEFAHQLSELCGPTAIAANAISSGAGKAQLWQWRERHTESIAAAGIARKCDIAAPPATLTELVKRSRDVAEHTTPGCTVVRFGHIAEGNVHVNILGGDSDTEAAVLACAAELGGSISAEHGIGRQKRRLLGLCRTSEEICHLERLRKLHDPHRVLNPNILTAAGDC